ncbi:ABC transporter permease [Nocardia inohanensis]|uniref:ABC transporter permease n=1 Tax=Nocardia inohanensis TaxID=209246 RepID=UPI00082B97AE|nr:ABC transporter permease [Nocardia inohanensis]
MNDTATRHGVWRIVAQREILVKLRDRNFLISTGITMLLLIASLVVSALVGGRTETVDIAVTGQGATEVIELAGQLAEQADAKKSFAVHELGNTAAVEQQVRDDSAEAGLVPAQPGGWQLLGKTGENDAVNTYVGAAVRQLAIARNAAAAGLSLEQLGQGATVNYVVLEPDSVDEGLAKIAAVVFGFLFYLASILFGLSIAQSVVEEKQNRIVEILASAIPLRQLLIGKVLGNAVMAFGQLLLFVGAGLAGLAATGKGDQISQIGGAAGWFVVFFVVGFLALASLWAVAGAVATRNEDLQATSTPLTMFLMAVLFAGIFLSGTALTIASYVPIVSVVAMPSRLAAGTANWWEPLIALAIMGAATYGTVVLAEKIYRRSLMQTQGRISIRQALALED